MKTLMSPAVTHEKAHVTGSYTCSYFSRMRFHCSKRPANQMVALRSQVVIETNHTSLFRCCGPMNLSRGRITWLTPSTHPPPFLLAFYNNRKMPFLCNGHICGTILRLAGANVLFEMHKMLENNAEYFIRFLCFCWLHFNAVHRWLASFEWMFFLAVFGPKKHSFKSTKPTMYCIKMQVTKTQKSKKYCVIFRALYAPHTRHSHQPSAI